MSEVKNNSGIWAQEWNDIDDWITDDFVLCD